MNSEHTALRALVFVSWMRFLHMADLCAEVTFLVTTKANASFDLYRPHQRQSEKSQNLTANVGYSAPCYNESAWDTLFVVSGGKADDLCCAEHGSHDHNLTRSEAVCSRNYHQRPQLDVKLGLRSTGGYFAIRCQKTIEFGSREL